MANLPVPTPAQEAPGNFITGALWNANVTNGINFLVNPPVFHGYQAASQSIPNTAVTPISIDTTDIDSYAGHSTTVNNSRYTAQVAGWYLVIGFIDFSVNAAGARVTILQKNTSGQFASNGVDCTRTDINANVQAVGTVYLAVGDYVQVCGYQSTGAALSTIAGSFLATLFIHS
jgi:hypothetical protein